MNTRIAIFFITLLSCICLRLHAAPITPKRGGYSGPRARMRARQPDSGASQGNPGPLSWLKKFFTRRSVSSLRAGTASVAPGTPRLARTRSSIAGGIQSASRDVDDQEGSSSVEVSVINPLNELDGAPESPIAITEPLPASNSSVAVEEEIIVAAEPEATVSLLSQAELSQLPISPANSPWYQDNIITRNPGASVASAAGLLLLLDQLQALLQSKDSYTKQTVRYLYGAMQRLLKKPKNKKELLREAFRKYAQEDFLRKQEERERSKAF